MKAAFGLPVRLRFTVYSALGVPVSYLLIVRYAADLDDTTSTRCSIRFAGSDSSLTDIGSARSEDMSLDACPAMQNALLDAPDERTARTDVLLLDRPGLS